MEFMTFVGGILLGVIIGWLSLWSYLSRPAGRFVARLFAVFALGLGALTLVWGIIAGATRVSLRFPGDRPLITHWGEMVATGAGFLVAGIASLVLSFVGRGWEEQTGAPSWAGLRRAGPAEPVGDLHRPEERHLEERPVVGK
jgi:hypothetical protein